MAAKQPHATLPGAEPEPVHPSLGNPGDQLYYVPDDLGVPGLPSALGREEAIDLIDGQQPGAQTLAPLITVAVPPSVVHTIFAHRQWRSGMLCADLVFSSIQPHQLHRAPLIDLAGKRVLELGAGTALPSILSARAPSEQAPAQIVVTDYDEAVLIDRLRSNVRANTQEASCKVNILGHIWGTNPDDLLDLLPCPRGGPEPKFDIIFLADCLWDALSHAALLLSVTRTLARTPSARVYVTSGLHTGREIIAAFIRRARREGLKPVPWLQLCAEDRPPGGSFLRPAPPHTDGESDPWACVLEAQLAAGVEVELPASVLPGRTHVPSTVSSGRRLTGVTRPFVDRERPEERQEVGGVKERNKWIVAWAMTWTEEALRQESSARR